MNRQRFEEIWRAFVAKEMPLMISKGADYSNNEEALQNFKDAADFLGTTTPEIAITYLMKHLSAIKNMLGSPPSALAWTINRDGVMVEGPLQKISDARNYLAIFAMCLEDYHGIKCDFGEGK
jgi:hypothetical protein